MRSLKLTTAITAAATLLALAPAGASAAGTRQHAKSGRHASAIGSCHISIFAEPHLVTSGESVQVFGQLGQLGCPGGATTTGQTITVYQRTAGTGGFQVLGSATTGAGGLYSIVAPNVTANSSFYARAIGARSPNRTVRVAPQVTLKGPVETAQLRTGTGRHNRVTFSGTVTPADAGAIVVLQRENATSSEEWHVIQREFVGEGGVYSITHTFGVPGDANIRVVVRAHSRFSVRGISNTLSYNISQTENPRLTINSSTDPIGYGQSTTLTGTLAGGANQPVTLLARTTGTKFAPVTKATTNGSGEYSFVQTPLQNTSYKVTGGAVNSAVLFEGVKNILTAGVSATTVQSGKTLTFSGTVTPARVGHVVYLERENAFGGGFHVVNVGTVAADSTYSIVQPIFGSGKGVFRVKVPGDPVNQAASSSPFTIEVTPAAPGALRPRQQSKLPREGQV